MSVESDTTSEQTPLLRTEVQPATIDPALESELQFNSSLKPLRNKYAPCVACDREPPMGRKFSACGGCKAVVYCSKECQTGHWQEHKFTCKKYQWVQLVEEALKDKPPPVDSLFPSHLSFTERGTLIRDFFKVHEWAFKSAINNVVYNVQRERRAPMNPKLEGITIALRYRTDNNDGNPARTFCLSGMGVYKKSDLAKWHHSGPQMNAEGRKRREDEWRRIYGDRYLGPLTVLFEAEEVKCGIQQPLLRLLPEEKAFMARITEKWFPVLQNGIDIGFVWEPSAPGLGTRDLVPGEMHKEGKIWKWKQLTRNMDELAQSNAMAQFSRIRLGQALDAYALAGISLPEDLVAEIADPIDQRCRQDGGTVRRVKKRSKKKRSATRG